MKFYLTGQKLERVDELETIANNSIDYTEAEFVIDNPRFKEKEINAINAIFQNEEIGVSYTVKLDDTYKVDVPYAAIKDTEQVNISLVALSDNRVYTTSQVKVKLKNSGYNDTETPGEPTPTVYQQLLSEMNGKQNKLTAGNNITISEDNVISATGGESITYTAGDNIQISSENVISATNNKYSIIKDEVPGTPNSIAEYHLVDITSGQPVEVGESIPIPNQSLTAGENVTINNGIISADVSMQDISELNGKIDNLNTNKQGKLTAGDNITISEDNVISATGGATFTAGDYINIENNKISAKLQKSIEDAGDNLATIQNLYDLEDANMGADFTNNVSTNYSYCNYSRGVIKFSVTGAIPAGTYLVGDDNTYITSYLDTTNYNEPRSLIFNSDDYDIDLIFVDNGVETVYNKKCSINVTDRFEISLKLKVKSDINVVSLEDRIRIAIVPTTLVPYVINTKNELNKHVYISQVLETAEHAEKNAEKFAYENDYAFDNNLLTSDFIRPKFYANINNGNPKMVEDAPDEMKQIPQENLFAVFISKDKAQCGYDEMYNYYYIYVYRLQVHYLDNGTYKIANYIKYIYTKEENTYQTEWIKEDVGIK